MKKLLCVIPFLVSSLFAQMPGAVPAFKLEKSEIELTRLAQPYSYFDKVGRRFAVLGYESGSFEAWAYPLKLFRNFEFSFLLGSSTEPILGKNIVRTISVTPAATVLTYVFQSFTVRAIYITPIDQPGSLILLEVNSIEPLTIVCSFLPVLQPMWPAGIGGQRAGWSKDLNAYVISEPTRKNFGFLGSPCAEGISYTPAHMLSDVPNQFKIVIKDPQTVHGVYLPIVMAGGKGERDSLQAIYKMLATKPEQFYKENVEYYKKLSAQTMHVTTPSKEFDRAFEWAKISYDNLFVHNPDLGNGMIAGLGPAGTGGRPGFGWFFSGDTYMNTFSMIGYGASEMIKDALSFTQLLQRKDGKMCHELTQSASYIRWFEDYPYAYIHGDTSPYYLTAMYEYFRMTADTAFIKQSWNSLLSAYRWSRETDSDDDGLMNNDKAGLAGVEYGPLKDVQSDISMATTWIAANIGMGKMAHAVGEEELVKKIDDYTEIALKTFDEKFWDEKNSQYSFAFDAKGNKVPDLTMAPAAAAAFKIGQKGRIMRYLTRLNSSELTTDWGIRYVSNKSKYYEPLGYNYGAAWPFATGISATALYRNHFSLQGFVQVTAAMRHMTDNSLGNSTELFSGSQNIWPQEGVAHQGFSIGGFVQPFVRGLLGLEGDATKKEFVFSPQLPANWDTLTIENYALGDAHFSIAYRRGTASLTANIRGLNCEGYKIKFQPALGIGTKIKSVKLNGNEINIVETATPQSIIPSVEFDYLGNSLIEIDFDPTFELLPPVIDCPTGSLNTGLKIISSSWKNKKHTIVLEGLGGEIYLLPAVHLEAIASVQGCKQVAGGLEIEFPATSKKDFVRKEITVQTK
jgi:glycogen debranching enzyme